jgi:DNA gyrase/topoisomerase IV subunit A
MARRTLAEEITQLETERDALETLLSEQERYSELEAQGTEGAKTRFTDPKKLYERLDKIKNRLSVLYTRSDMWV